jgi:cytochrome oxidase complex assembly protein 1
LTSSDRSPAPAPGKSRGYLWGCLAALVLVAIVAGGAPFYGAWLLREGFRNDPALQNAMAQVRSNHVAQDVLGNGIVVESMESETFSATKGKGKTVTYALHVKGDKAAGELHILLHSSGREMKIVSMVLTGPGEERYNLTGVVPSPSGSI